MSGNNYPKKMQVHLTEAQHQAFKDYAYRSKVSMMECVRGWIGEKCNGSSKEPSESRKGAVVSLESPQEAAGVGRKCSVCDLVVRQWVYDKKGKEICVECAERLAGSNP